jgi:hypothetical protein
LMILDMFTCSFWLACTSIRSWMGVFCISYLGWYNKSLWTLIKNKRNRFSQMWNPEIWNHGQWVILPLEILGVDPFFLCVVSSFCLKYACISLIGVQTHLYNPGWLPHLKMLITPIKTPLPNEVIFTSPMD